MSKAIWFAQFQGDSKPWAADVDWPDLEFEVSVVRGDYKLGIDSAGWAERDRKIILFGNEDNVIESADDIEYFMQVAGVLAEGLNKRKL